MSSHFLAYVATHPEASFDEGFFPGTLSFVQELHYEFHHPVTFFVGENGSGKSSLLEALAVLIGLPLAGGSFNDIGEQHGLEEECPLAECLRLAFHKQPRDAYFFRAELQAHFASLLEKRRNDPDFTIDSYKYYGGRSLLLQSHGEAFLSVMKNRFRQGLFLMDEPESALSPKRQLSLLALIHDLVQNGKTQFLIATHSPILLTYPGASLVSFDEGPLHEIELEETSHFQITQGILSNRNSYWKHLLNSE